MNKNTQNNKKLQLAFSPCPNDTFMFDALINHRMGAVDLDFDYHLADIETLNLKAFDGYFDVTKLSFHALLYLAKEYTLLDAGCALGRNCGPVLIAREPFSLEKLAKATIAIPGRYTTANLLFSLAFPESKVKKEILFSDIENAVLTRRVDAGVIIHESRFTFEQRGLIKLMDLGEWWESETGCLIPLGCIVIKQSAGSEIIKKTENLIRKSIEYAFENPEHSSGFVKNHARETLDSVIRQHIQLYVNKFSISLGEEGRKAVETLFEKAAQVRLIP